MSGFSVSFDLKTLGTGKKDGISRPQCLDVPSSRYPFYELNSYIDGTIGVRMLEYDFYIGIRESKPNEEGVYQVKLPRSCVICIRHNENTEDEIPGEIILSDKAKMCYKVPVIKVQQYSLEEMFKKKLAKTYTCSYNKI